PVYRPAGMLGPVPLLLGVDPDRDRQRVETTYMIPMHVRHHDATQPPAVVPGRVELAARRPHGRMRRTLDAWQQPQVILDIGTEAGVNEQVTSRMLHENRGSGERALVPEGTALHRESRARLIRAGRQLIDRHIPRRASTGKTPRPSIGLRKRRHEDIVRGKMIRIKTIRGRTT